jgi:hypothetical protein
MKLPQRQMAWWGRLKARLFYGLAATPVKQHPIRAL